MSAAQTATATVLPPNSAQQVATDRLPQILVVGERDNTVAIERALEQLDAEVRHYPSVEDARDAISRSVLAVVLVHPLPDEAPIDAVATLAPRPTPVVVVVPDEYADLEAQRLYEAGAAAVVGWPYEALVLPVMLADLAGALPDEPANADERLTRVVHARVAQRIEGEIDVQVVGGSARVTGRVPSYWSKRRVANILEHVPGITAVSTSKLEVVPEERSDEEVLKAARDLLSCLSGVDPKTVSVSVEDGVLSLAGTVQSHASLERLLSVLGNVEGVRDLRDHVVVSRTATQQGHELAAKLEQDVQGIWPTAETRVTVFGGIAVLTGHSPTLADKRAIASFVADADGIDRVVNKLAVVAAG